MIGFTQAFYFKASKVAKQFLDKMAPEQKARTVSIWEEKGVMPDDFLQLVKPELIQELNALHATLESDVFALQNPDKIVKLKARLPRDEEQYTMDDWYLVEQINSLISDYDKKIEDARKKVTDFDKTINDSLGELRYLPIPK